MYKPEELTGPVLPTPNEMYIRGALRFNPDLLDQQDKGKFFKFVGNVAILSNYFPEYVKTFAVPTDLDSLLAKHPDASCYQLAKIAQHYEYALQDPPTNVTADVLAAQALLGATIKPLPEKFELQLLPEGDDEPTLVLRRTPDAELLFGVVAAEDETKGVNYMKYIKIAPNGIPANVCSYFAEAFDRDGNTISDLELMFPRQMDDKLKYINLNDWLSYLNVIGQLLQANQSGDIEATKKYREEILGLIKTSRTAAGSNASDGTVTSKNILAPTGSTFFDGMEEVDKAILTIDGYLPENFVPEKLPNWNITNEGLHITGMEEARRALENWGIPYVEVSYTAGARTIDMGSDVTIKAIMDNNGGSRIPQLYRHLLPADTKYPILQEDKLHDLYALVPTGKTTQNGEVIFAEVLVYDGVLNDRSRHSSSAAKLKIPQAVYEIYSPNHNKTDETRSVPAGVSAGPLRRTDARPTTQEINRESSYHSEPNFVPWSQKQTGAQDAYAVRFGDGRNLPISEVQYEDLMKPTNYSLEMPVVQYTLGIIPRLMSTRKIVVAYNAKNGGLVPTVKRVISEDTWVLDRLR